MRLRNIPAAYPAIENSPYCVTDGTEHFGNWGSFFPKKQPLYIEIGMGKGQFILKNATKYPDINFLGMELYESVLYRGLQKFERLEEPLPNLRFLRGDAKDIATFFAPGEVDRIYLNFSDPWPKDRHAKRRLTSPEFLERYDKILVEGGEIQFKTDNVGLFSYSLEVLKDSKIWEVVAESHDLHHDSAMNEGNIMTEYEEKFSSMGNPICKLIAKRRK